MARAEPVTQAAVFAAADSLSAKNIKPTLEAIRAEIGGSYNTLTPLLKAWRSQQVTQASAVLDMPDSMFSAVRGLAGELWKSATDEAATRTRGLEAAAEQRVVESEAEASELAGAVQSLEVELVAMRSSFASYKEEATRELAEERAAHSSIKDLSSSLRSDLVAANTMLEDANRRSDALQQELIALARDIAGKSGGKK